MSPSQYLEPWSFAPDGRAAAARALLRALEDAGGTVTAFGEAAGETLVRAEVPVPGGRPGEVDIVSFRLLDDGTALFSSAATLNRPDPPFCLTPGCVSGPAGRGRMAALRDALGWVPLAAEGGEDARWVQILLH